MLAAAQAHWFVDFDSGGLEGWHLPIPEHWQLADSGGNRMLRLVQGGPIGEAPRRPVKFALFKPGCVTDFELQVKLRRDAIQESEADLLVAFGYQDRLHFYYAHLSSDNGDIGHHNGIFKVDGGDRTRIAGKGSKPALPDQQWRRIKIVRTTDSGRMEVFVDGEAEPRFHATDGSFRYGLVGIGSFNDSGSFDDFRLSGNRSDECRLDRLSPLDP